MKNARFWTWWNDGMIKLTLKPGQELRFWRSERHEEGWSSTLEEYEYDGDEILSRIIEDGQDCDGRVTRADCYSCPIGELAAHYNPNSNVWVPNWKKESASVNDQFARAMNY